MQVRRVIAAVTIALSGATTGLMLVPQTASAGSLCVGATVNDGIGATVCIPTPDCLPAC